MKKAYKKPELAFESFELSQSIAAGCMYISNHGSIYNCSVKTDWETVFVTNDVCDRYVPELEVKICYHVPNDDYRIFTS